MLLLHLSDVDEAGWARRLKAELGDYPLVRREDDFDPRDIRYLFVWKPKADAFEGLDRLKAILSLGAGVDALLKHPALPPDVPLVRFVAEDLSQRMSDYVVANVTMHHRQFNRFKADQAARRWVQFYPPSAEFTTVGIMGLGSLGIDAARRLLALGFSVRGWSRTPKAIAGVESFAGESELDAFLSGTGILNYQTFAKLRRDGLEGGPVVINAARGGHQKEADIVKALSDGTLSAASLDVFEVEPLPAESPLWALPNCYITPHIAAISNMETGAAYFARMIRDHEAGQPLRNVVDRDRGY